MDRDIAIQVGSTLGATLVFVFVLILISHINGGRFLLILAVIGFILLESAIGFYIAENTDPG